MTTELKKDDVQTKEVDLGDVKLTLPTADADKVIQWRDADKQSRRDLGAKLSKAEAEKVQAESARAKAEEDKAALEAAKKNDADAIREIMTREHKARELRLSEKARDKHLAALIGSNDKVAKTAVSDIVEQLKGKTRYDFDSETVVVMDADGSPAKDKDGKPLNVDSFVGSWLENRPHYLRDGTQKGTGAANGTKPSSKSITTDELKKMTPTEQGKFFLDGGVLLK